MSVELTKDSDALICLIYKEYLSKRKEGVAKIQAKIFGSSYEIQESLIPKLSKEDVDETCWELDRAGLLDCFRADAHAYTVELTDKGIIYMENRFKNGIKDVLEHLASIKSAIPFL